jgi:hypothetical protein
LDSIQLLPGTHEPCHHQFCAMELLAYLAGKPHSYSPSCASKVIAGFVSWINDWMTDEERQVLKPFVVRTFGTVGTVEQEQQRAFMCADWAIHFAAPLELRASGFDEQGAKFEALPSIDSEATARAALKDAARATGRLDWTGFDMVAACLGSAMGTSTQSAEDLAAEGVNGTWAYWAGANAVRCLPVAVTAAARGVIIENALTLVDRLIAVAESETILGLHRMSEV